MADCNDGCSRDIAEATFIYAGIDFPLHDEGDLVVFDVEETEFNEHTDHRGDNEVYSFKAATKVDITVNLNPCSAEYKALFELWRCNKGLCSEAIANKPCCGIDTYERVKVKKMGIPPISHDNEATEVVFTGYLPSCS
jgi:hypothetical protein